MVVVFGGCFVVHLTVPAWLRHIVVAQLVAQARSVNLVGNQQRGVELADVVFFHQLAACVLFVTIGLSQGENERRRHIAHQRRRVFDRQRDAFDETAPFLAREIEQVARLRIEFAYFRQLVNLGFRHFH